MPVDSWEVQSSKGCHYVLRGTNLEEQLLASMKIDGAFLLPLKRILCPALTTSKTVLLHLKSPLPCSGLQGPSNPLLVRLPLPCGELAHPKTSQNKCSMLENFRPLEPEVTLRLFQESILYSEKTKALKRNLVETIELL